MDVMEGFTRVQQGWFDHLQRAERESLSIRAYALREGLSAQSLYGFRQWLKRRMDDSGRVAALPRFASVQVAAPVSDAAVACVLEFQGGLRVRLAQVPDPRWLATVLGQACVMRPDAVSR